MSGNMTAALTVVAGELAIVVGVLIVFGIGWAAIVAGLLLMLMGFGFVYDHVARETERKAN